MDASEKLVLTLPGGMKQEFTLSKASVTIGRATVNDIVVRDAKVSRNHIRVERGTRGFEVVDLGSANGVRVNGLAVRRALLVPGDVLNIGDTNIHYESGDEQREAAPARIDTLEELEQTLLGMPLSVHLTETDVPRVAIHTDTKTWEVAMHGDRLTIGRDRDNDVVLEELNVSRHHAVLERRENAVVLRDLASGNGTWLRGDRVSQVALDDSSTIRIGSARLVFKQRVTSGELETLESKPAARGRRRVVVIPGFGGSTLWHGSEQVWPSPRMLLTHPDLLDIDQHLEARELVDEVVVIPNLIRQEQYSSLTDFLKESLQYEKGKDLLEFAYDFRQDNRISARRLAAAIDGWKGSGPITIVAHSMGCLIARYFVERLGGHRLVDRIVYLGAPHLGTPYAFASLLKGPDLLPLGLLNARLREVLAAYPSWYQILPTYPFVSDQRAKFEVLDDEGWVADEQRPLLRLARDFRRELGSGSKVPSVCVFGYGIRTITTASVEREPSGACRKADLLFDLKGDGMIPESSALLPGAEIHPVQQRHGALYGNTDVKMRLRLELTRGN